jgi:uncharacterized damage-inducible protein DinB
MTIPEALLATFDIELPSTRRILEHVPTSLPDWAPHPKSMSLGNLAMHVATLPSMAKAILTNPSFDLSAPQPAAPTVDAAPSLLTIFDTQAAELRALLAQSTDDDLSATWTLHAGPHILVESPRSVALLHNFLGHLIHHRAQLGVYLRLNDLHVPGVYGPSANDKEARQTT